MTVLSSGSGHAQFGEAFPVWFNLRDQDVTAIDRAADRILENEPLKPGLTESWEGMGNGGGILVSGRVGRQRYRVES